MFSVSAVPDFFSGDLIEARRKSVSRGYSMI